MLAQYARSTGRLDRDVDRLVEPPTATRRRTASRAVEEVSVEIGVFALRRREYRGRARWARRSRPGPVVESEGEEGGFDEISCLAVLFGEVEEVTTGLCSLFDTQMER